MVCIKHQFRFETVTDCETFHSRLCGSGVRVHVFVRNGMKIEMELLVRPQIGLHINGPVYISSGILLYAETHPKIPSIL